MTAVISLLRSVPIYAPGADAPCSGSAAMPNHTLVTTADEAAAAKRDFEDSKLAKRKYPVGYRPAPAANVAKLSQEATQALMGDDKACTSGFESDGNYLSLHNTGQTHFDGRW